MRVFVTGASGFIGSATARDLLDAGHQVLGLARSDKAASAVAAAGAEVHRGALDDLDSLTRGAKAADGVIHTAFVHDFSNMAAAGLIDRRAVETMGAALEGSGKPFIVTSGLAHLKIGQVSTEDDAPNTASTTSHRIASELVTLALASSGVRASVMRFPPSVHGEGDHGFVPALIAIARQKGVSAYVGDGSNRWPSVHRRDAARAFRLAVESGPAGSRFHAVAEQGVRFRDIAEIIGRQLGIPVVSKTREEAAGHFGWLGAFAALDCPASSLKTQEILGWQPTQPGLVSDLGEGHYFGK